MEARCAHLYHKILQYDYFFNVMAYRLLGILEIPSYIVRLEQIVLDEFHANSNRIRQQWRKQRWRWCR